MINIAEKMYMYVTNLAPIYAQFNNGAFTEGAGFTPLAFAAFFLGILVALGFLYGAVVLVVGAFSAIAGGASLRSAIVTTVVVLLVIAFITVIANFF